MTFEVDFTVLKGDEHISVHTAWIDALDVTECKSLANGVAGKINVSEKAIYLHIGELEQWEPLQRER